MCGGGAHKAAGRCDCLSTLGGLLASSGLSILGMLLSVVFPPPLDLLHGDLRMWELVTLHCLLTVSAH